MVHADVVTKQLHRIGANSRFLNRPELNELPKILLEGEQIMHVSNGRYEGGFALLVSTDLRVLLIDKKPFYLTLEDIRYERISDVQLSHRLLDATLRLGSLSKDLIFTGFNPSKMRDMTSYIQEQVMRSRQSRQQMWQGPEQAPQFSGEPQFQPAPYVPQPAAQQLAQPVAHATPTVEFAPQVHAGQIQSADAAALGQATEVQTEAIGQVAVTATEALESTPPSAYEQVVTAMTMGASPEQAPELPANPYRTPLTFRRRVSRFY